MPNSNELLKPLEHLSYLIECAAQDYQGELKGELGLLIDHIEAKAAGYSHLGVSDDLSELKRAHAEIYSGKSRVAISKLIAVNRRWWKLQQE